MTRASRHTDDTALRSALVVSGSLVGELVLGRATRDALVLTHFGATGLSRVAIATAFLSVAMLLATSRLMAKHSPSRILSAAIVVNAALLALEIPLVRVAPRATAVAIHLHLGALSGPLLSIFWSLVSERFDPHRARRAFARLSAAGAAGGAIGAASGLWLGGTGGAQRLLAILLAINAVAFAGTVSFARKGSASAASPRAAEIPSLRTSLHSLAGVGYLRWLAVIVFSLAIVESLLDYVLAARVAEITAHPLDLLVPLHLGISLASVVVLALAGRLALNRLGLGGTAEILPAVLALVGTVGLAGPGVAVAFTGRGLHGVLRSSFFRSAYEVLFTPLEPSTKRGVKVLVDVGADRAGAIVGSALAALAAELGRAPAERLAWGAIAVLSVATLLVARRLDSGYVRALDESLRRGVLDPDVDPTDATTRWAITQTQMNMDREQLLQRIAELTAERAAPAAPASFDAARSLRVARAALASGEAGRVASIVEARPVDPHLVPDSIELLERDDLAPRVVRALASTPHAVESLVAALGDTRASDVVRCRIPRILARNATEPGTKALERALDDSSPRVRRAAAAALAHVMARAPDHTFDRDAVRSAALREFEAEDAAAHRDHLVTLVALTVHPTPVRLAIRALDERDRSRRGTAIEYLEHVVPEDLFRAAVRLLTSEHERRASTARA